MTIDLEGTIMSKYTFENFVVGKNNEFAYKIAKSVAEKKMSYIWRCWCWKDTFNVCDCKPNNKRFS